MNTAKINLFDRGRSRGLEVESRHVKSMLLLLFEITSMSRSSGVEVVIELIRIKVESKSRRVKL